VILQQLQQDASRLVPDMPPSMYAWKPVRWVVHLESDGRCQWPPEPMAGGGKKDRGKRLLVPFKNRSGTMAPALLLVDKRSFTWGLSLDGPRAQAEHGRYLELLGRCAVETGNPDVAVIARFLRERNPEQGPLPEEMQPDELTTFTVAGRFPIDDPSVRAFWARQAGGEVDAGETGQCLVCGAHTHLVERLPVLLKGIARSTGPGVALVAADKSAYQSFGRKAALTSPICHPCGERYGNAANALLADSKKHISIGPVTYLFWAPGSSWDAASFLSAPDPEEVRILLDSARRGFPPASGDDSGFYSASLSANISRAVVRGWLETTVGEARRHLTRWFELQRIVDPDGKDGTPLSVVRLVAAAYRELKDIQAGVPETLFRTALYGGPLPVWLLQQVLQRSRADAGNPRQPQRPVTYERAALIKATLCSDGKENPEAMTSLNPKHPSAAYHCGRLLAELEDIQRTALGKINATIVDRYFGTASSAPASVFGRLLTGAQPHLAKLRKTSEGAYYGAQTRLEETMQPLAAFPMTLTLKEQALFSLGYYHQRAATRAARAEAKARKVERDETERSQSDGTEENH
jgi:CRISPR-associated protein Csd1